MDMELSVEQIDALKEVTNIAAYKAANALSEMLKTQTLVMMNVEQHVFSEITEFHETKNIQRDSLVLGLRAIVTKELPGAIFIVIRLIDLIDFLNRLKYLKPIKKSIKKIEDLNRITRSAIQELGNIMISQFCSAISDFLHIIMYHEVPEMVIGEYFSLLEGEFVQTSIHSDQIMQLRTEITTKEQSLAGEMIFIPNYDAYRKILEILTVNGVLGLEKS